ncbi:MAG: (Fe-S)-binding protein [Actinomycetota bacterium]
MSTAVRVTIGFAIITLATGFALKRISYLFRLLVAARRDPDRFKRILPNLKYEVIKVLGQKKLLQWKVPGVAHALTFWGFLVIQVTLLESTIELFDREGKIPWIGHHAWLGFIEDTFILAVAVALVVFAIIRLQYLPKLLGRKSRFYSSHMWQAYLILIMIFLVVSTVLVVRGARAALDTLPYPSHGAFLSHWAGNAMDHLSTNSLHWLEDGFLLGHIAVVMSFLVLVVNSKHMHIFTSAPNVLFGRQPLALGRLQPLHIDMENMTDETVIGVGKVEDFSWKQLFDTLTCTECGRCQSVCPAWNTGKELNPKQLMMWTRDNLLARGPELTGNADPGSLAPVNLVPDVFSDEFLWSCVTCGACVYECPVDIEHVDAIIDLRRYQVMMESKFPQEAGALLRNLENSGNPWGAPAQDRLDWVKGMEDDVIVVNGRIPPDVEYLYWVGCAGAFDDRAKKAVRAFAELMTKAGVSYAILGGQESCTGDPARRMGNEYLYQEMAKANIATLKEKGVQKIVASCPHCFNTIGREYPDFGGEFKVLHHTELLAELIKDGKLKPEQNVDAKVTYHDPCYLARHNDVMKQPRTVVGAIPGVESEEMHRCKRGTFCCGAGGARMWMEETAGKRINHERIEEALGTNPDIVSTGCPYCMIMLDDAVKDKVQKREASEHVQVLDVAQILARSVGLNGRKQPAPATTTADAGSEPQS